MAEKKEYTEKAAPGSPKAAKENLSAVLPILEHGLRMLSGQPADCAGSSNKQA